MVRYVIDRLSESDIAKYRERSVKAINGIQMLLSNPSIVLDKPTIYGKYLTIAAYIGLVTENNKSAYNNFIPTNSNNLFLLRFSDHDNTNPQLYDVHEQMGRPNARNIICFSYNDIEAKNGEWNETRHIVVPYGENALDNEDSIISFLYALSRLFIDGETNYPLLPITNQDDGHMSPNDEINQWNRTIDKNNETNESKNMKKNTIKLNESQLRKMIAESVKKVFNESIAEDCIRETEFQKITSPCNAFKRTSKEMAEKLKNNGFSYMQDYRNQIHCNLTNGPGYYFMKQDLGSSYGDTLVSVEIRPGARIKFEEQNDIIIVHPEDGDKIKITDIKTTSPGQITEQKLRKMIAESIKIVLNEYISPWRTPDSSFNVDDIGVQRWNYIYNKPNEYFNDDTETYVSDYDDSDKA